MDRQDERPASPDGATGMADQGTIDIERLADRVYRLLLADVRLGRARGETPRRERMGQ